MSIVNIRVWVAILLLADFCFASSSGTGISSSSADTIAEAYVLTDAGQIGRVNLKTGAYEQKATPSASSGLAIGVISNSGRAFYADSNALHVQEWMDVSVLSSFARNYDQARYFGRVDALGYYGSMIYVAYTTSGLSQIRSYNVDDTSSTTWGSSEYWVYKKIVPYWSGVYALTRDVNDSSHVVLVSGGVDNEIMRANERNRKLLGLAMDPSYASLYSWDSLTKKIVRITISDSSVQELNLQDSMVRDLRVSNDTTFWWVNGGGLWKGKNGGAPALVSPVMGIQAFDIDWNNVWEHFSITPSPLQVPIGGDAALRHNTNIFFSNDYMYDSLTCAIEPLTATRFTPYRLGPCGFVIAQNVGNPSINEMDSLRMVMTDRRGNVTNKIITLQYRANLAPTLTALPSNIWSAYSYQENRFTFRFNSESGDVQDFSIMQAVDSIINLSTDTSCSALTAYWISQSFTTSSIGYGYLEALQVAAGYTVPVIVRVYQGLNALPKQGSYLMAEEYFPAQTNIGIHKYLFKQAPWLGSNSSYTIIISPADQTSLSGYMCPSATAYSGGNLRNSGLTTPMTLSAPIRVDLFNSSSGTLQTEGWSSDTARVLYIPVSTDVGKTYHYWFRYNDGTGVAMLPFHVNVFTGAIPTFQAGPLVRAAKMLVQDYNSISFPNWLNESYNTARYYQTDTVLGYGSFFSTQPWMSGNSLYLTPKAGVSGFGKFLIRRCYSDNVCTAYDTAHILYSTPPTLSVIFPDTLQANQSQSVPVTVADVDSNDLSYANVSAYKVFAGNTWKQNDTLMNLPSFAQTFQNFTNGYATGVQVYGAFPHSTVRVALYHAAALNSFNEAASSSSSALYIKTVSVDSTFTGWHFFELPRLWLDSGALYAIEMGQSYTMGSAAPMVLSAGKNGPQGELMNGDSGWYNAHPLGVDLNYSIEMSSNALSWLTISGSQSSWILDLAPMQSDSGATAIKVVASDGTGQNAVFKNLWVKPVPAPVLWSGGLPVYVSQSPVTLHRKILTWGDVSSLPSGVWFESKLLNSLDTARLGGAPIVQMDGTLEFSVRANVLGTVNFATRACRTSDNMCSEYDTAQIVIGAPPTISFTSLPDSLPVPSNVSAKLTLADADMADLQGLSVSLSQINPWVSDTLHQVFHSAQAMGQTFTSDGSSIGALRVYAKFPQSFVRVVVASAETEINGPENSLVDIFAPVTANVLQWHTLAIPSMPTLASGAQYHISLGNEKGTAQISYGVDTTGSFANGELVEYSVDSTGLDSSMNPVRKPAYDLSFALLQKTPSPVWAWIGVGSASSERFLWLQPSIGDIGSYIFSAEVNDGRYRTATLGSLRLLSYSTSSSSSAYSSSTIVMSSSLDVSSSSSILVLSSSLDLSSSSSNIIYSSSAYSSSSIAMSSSSQRVVIPNNPLVVITQGQAARIATQGLDPATLPSNATMKLRLLGTNVDSSWIMTSGAKVFAPLAPGSYRLSWGVVDSAAVVLGSGSVTFAVTIPVITPPQLSTWYMVGFGSESLPFTNFKTASLVFRWNESREAGINGFYDSRTDLVNSQPGFGYWYMAEDADTLMPSILTAMPSPLKLSLYNKRLGWNMISNPWSWPISLDSGFTFWSWQNSSGYKMVRVLPPHSAAWVHVDRDTSIVLNPSPMLDFDSTTTLARRLLPKAMSTRNWTLQAMLSTKSQSDAWNYFGVNSTQEASAVLDAPQSLGSQVSLSILSQGRALAQDIRSESDGRWELSLFADRDRNATLQLAGLASLRALGQQVVLTDPEGNSRVLSSESGSTLALRKGTSTWILRVGATSANKNLMVADLKDMHVRLVGHQWNLSYQVPYALDGQSGVVEWMALDGKVLARRSLSIQHSGLQSANWKDVIVPSGLCVIRVNVGRSVQTSKVLVP